MSAREYRRVADPRVENSETDVDSDSDWPTTACWKTSGTKWTGLLLAGVAAAFLFLDHDQPGPVTPEEVGFSTRAVSADTSVEAQYEEARIAFQDHVAALDVAGEVTDSEVRDVADGSSLKKLVPHGTRMCPERKPFPPVPAYPTKYNGISWPDMCFEDAGESHVFIMGDYGGVTCNDRVTMGPRDPNGWVCHGSRFRTGAYAKTADNTKDHGDRGRYLIHGVDDRAQQLVARQMRNRALLNKPNYALNGGDNFYFGGLDNKCGTPMDEIHPRTRLQFKTVFEDMYTGVDVPFFSVLGNHDFGGRHFDAAWDQQIAYTWAHNTTGRWILPAFYWKQRVNYPKGQFSIDYFMVDTNKGDAKPHYMDEAHNICGSYNAHGASCSKNRGPSDKFDCSEWFDKLWRKQATWLDQSLANSTANWKIVVSHFPPDQFQPHFWKDMHYRRNIHLFVGSHRHTEEIHMDDRRFAGLNWIVVGGGGGISSEWNPDQSYHGRDQYGFMDMTVSKEQLKIEAINEAGELRHTKIVYPSRYPGIMVDEAKRLAKTASWKESNSRKADETKVHSKQVLEKATEEKVEADRELAEKTAAETAAIAKMTVAKEAAEAANAAKQDADHLASERAAADRDASRDVGAAKSAAHSAARAQEEAENGLRELEDAEEKDPDAIAAAKERLAEKKAAAKQAAEKQADTANAAEKAAADRLAADNDSAAKRDASNNAWKAYGDAKDAARRASGEKYAAEKSAERKAGSAKWATDKAREADDAAAKAAAEYVAAKAAADKKAFILKG